MGLHFLTVLFQCEILRITLSISKIHGTLSSNPSIHLYINRVNNIFVFKMKDGYKVKLKTSEAIQIFGSTKN